MEKKHQAVYEIYSPVEEIEGRIIPEICVRHRIKFKSNGNLKAEDIAEDYKEYLERYNGFSEVRMVLLSSI